MNTSESELEILRLLMKRAYQGIGIEADAAGIGILAFILSVPYWTRSPYPGTGLIPASALLFILVPASPMPDSLAFRHSKKLYEGR